MTSFNARDLDKPLWRNAIRERRGLVFCTELGESQGKNKYLMRSKNGFALGAVYRKWNEGDEEIISMAIITRPPHPRFSKYHEKSIPFMLPMDKDFILEWLDPSINTSEIIQHELNNPKIQTDFEVTPFKSYVHGDAIDESEILERD